MPNVPFTGTIDSGSIDQGVGDREHELPIHEDGVGTRKFRNNQCPARISHPLSIYHQVQGDHVHLERNNPSRQNHVKQDVFTPEFELAKYITCQTTDIDVDERLDESNVKGIAIQRVDVKTIPRPCENFRASVPQVEISAGT